MNTLNPTIGIWIFNDQGNWYRLSDDAWLTS